MNRPPQPQGACHAAWLGVQVHAAVACHRHQTPLRALEAGEGEEGDRGRWAGFGPRSAGGITPPALVRLPLAGQLHLEAVIPVSHRHHTTVPITPKTAAGLGNSLVFLVAVLTVACPGWLVLAHGHHSHAPASCPIPSHGAASGILGVGERSQRRQRACGTGARESDASSLTAGSSRPRRRSSEPAHPRRR